MSGKGSQRGSLIVDWSTGLSLAASVLLAVPGLRTFVHESQRAAVVNELQLELRRAARAADQLGQTVTLCGMAADGRCAASGDWSSGWVAFIDVDGDGAMGERETRLELWRLRSDQPQIAVNANPRAFSFRPFYAAVALGASTSGHFTVCDRAGHGGSRTLDVRRGTPELGAAGARCPS